MPHYCGNRAVRLYFKLGSTSAVADELQNGDEEPRPSAVSKRVNAMVWQAAQFLESGGTR